MHNKRYKFETIKKITGMTESVTMTAEERAEFEAFKAQKEKKRAAEAREKMRKDYAKLVDDEVKAAIPQLQEMSDSLRTVKETVYDNFATILRMKAELLGVDTLNQQTHSFTTSDGMMRLTLGTYMIDGYRDTVEEGIEMVKSYLESLAKDAGSQALVGAVFRLLSRDRTGTIKASRVLQLRRMAEESGDEKFLEGVRIIEEAYQPTVSKRFIRAEIKNDKGAWVNIPLGMTDAN